MTSQNPLPTTLTPPNAAPCGRPDKITGRPCAVVAERPPVTGELIERIDKLYGPRACPSHASANDRALAQALDRTWNDAFNYGREMGRRESSGTTARHEPPLGSVREYDLRGRQLVTVRLANGQDYTYSWANPHGDGPLRVGDVVLLPANQVNPQPHEGTVSGLGSAYQGKTAAVLYLKRRAPQD